MTEPPPDAAFSAKTTSKRPVYLVIALLLVWMVGLFGATDGCQTIDVLHHPESVRVALDHIADIEIGKRQEAFVEAILKFRQTATPLAVGQLLLGSLLTFTAGLTLLGRGQARKVVLQAMVVYALFLPVDYVLRRPIRAVVIDTIASTFPTPDEGEVAPSASELRIVYWWVYRGALGAQLTILTLGLFAMTRPRVRAFFRAAAAVDPAGGRDV